MDGFNQTPGSAFLVASTPSTIRPPQAPDDTPKAPSEIEQLTSEIRKLTASSQTMRADYDRRITELSSQNQLLLKANEDQMLKARESGQKPPSPQPNSEVDQLWNGFFTDPQQPPTPPAGGKNSGGDVTKEELKKLMLETIQEVGQKADTINANNEEIEKALFQKFTAECPDLHPYGQQVLQLWRGFAQANPALIQDPQRRYALTVNKARELYGGGRGQSLPAAGDGRSGGPTPRAKESAFERAAREEQDAEMKRKEDLEKYVTARKRKFQERTGFPYHELEQ